MPPKRRRRFQGLYYHSSPPKVLPMNGQIANSNGRRTRGPDDFAVKLSTIRIWMHEKDIGKLTRVLWASQGNRLRQQASTNAKVKRFLAAVPYVMNSIKDVHQAVIDNNLENLQANLEPPVPPALVTCRDANGLNLIHKAAGLGHATILEYLITTWPDGVHETDITGKTPLHWAASAKNNMRCYTLLTQAGCDEEAVDYKMKTPSFYRHKPNEIERAFLTYVPEAPRVSPDVATDWEALSDDSGDGKKLDIKIPEMNGFGRHSIAESNENTSETDMAEVGHEAEDADAVKRNEKMSDKNDHSDGKPEAVESADQQEDEPIGEESTEHEKKEKEEADEEKEEEQKSEDSDKDQETQEEHKEAPDEKQTTQALTQTTEILSKDSEGVDIIEEKNLESKDHKNEHENIKANTGEHSGNNESQEINKNDNEKIGFTKPGSEENQTKENQEEEEKKSKDTKREKSAAQDHDQRMKESIEENKENLNEAKSEINNDKQSERILNEKNKINDETKSKETEEQTEPPNELSTEQETETTSPDNVIAIKEVAKENGDQDDSKTLGETLTNIKDEVKDNVKYLATQIKNVFSDEKDSHEIITSENLHTDDSEEKENHSNTQQETTTTHNKDQEERSQSPKQNVTAQDSKSKEFKEIIKQENVKDKEITLNNNDDKKEDSNNSNKTHAETVIPTIANQNSNSSNENSPLKRKTPPSPLVTTTTPYNEESNNKNEKDKTEEDENNNDSKMADDKEANTTTTHKTSPAETITDEQFKELDKSLEEYKKGEDTISQEDQQKQMGVKESVKEMTDNVINVFSTKTDSEKSETESSDVVLHAESPQKQISGKKSIKDGTSSEDTADEDEEPQAEAENEENNNKAEETNDTDIKTITENKLERETETEPETEPKPLPEQDASLKPVNETTEVKQNNEENAGQTEQDGESSPTSSLAIEGFVEGSAEDNTVQSQTAAYVDNDEETRLQSIIGSGDMEQLAQIVLNGDGQKLLNVEATEPEIQAFLKNVPNYMAKIRRVHEAARSGSLLNLQQALDRRKFAVAKDEMSPNGATPLHVAVLFGSSDIVRYLAARFPETTTIEDNDGRTALHYAAVINDNGHFYNVLLQLGANPKVADKMGHTPEDYLSNEKLSDSLNYGQLLKRFGAEDLETKLLNDQGRIENQSIQENPLFKTEQGKYLADNLADPLIKALTQVAQKRPSDPLQYLTNYLQNYVASRYKNGRTITQAAVHSGSIETSSTVSASSRYPTPPSTQIQRQTAVINSHNEFNNADNIEEDSMQQVDFDDDDGNDSDAAMSKKLEERDEHGQSMLHFACARSHRKGGLINLIEDAKADISYRDELYRTARDVALQANQLGNAKEIDRYVMSLAIVGDTKPFEHFAISGYDHIIDVLDDNDTPIMKVVEDRGLDELAAYLKTIRPLEELREELHQMIRDNNVSRVKEIAEGPTGRWVIKARNYYGRCALHIAILKESIEIVEMFVNLCPEALKIGDNLERTPLHYAMGTNIVESASRILIQNGAKRTYKDLKGRQPSYYFMNKADILRLQEEEDENR